MILEISLKKMKILTTKLSRQVTGTWICNLQLEKWPTMYCSYNLNTGLCWAHMSQPLSKSTAFAHLWLWPCIHLASCTAIFALLIFIDACSESACKEQLRAH